MGKFADIWLGYNILNGNTGNIGDTQRSLDNSHIASANTMVTDGNVYHHESKIGNKSPLAGNTEKTAYIGFSEICHHVANVTAQKVIDTQSIKVSSQSLLKKRGSPVYLL